MLLLMKKLLKTASVTASLLLSCWACIEIYPLAPPKDPPKSGSVCQAPPIEKNIVGTWHFASTYNPYSYIKPDTVTYGTVSFSAMRRIIDPDSLFENHLLNIPVTSRTYDPQFISPYDYAPGTFFTVYLTNKTGTQENYFEVVSNECNRIHMRQYKSGNNGIGFVLTR